MVFMFICINLEYERIGLFYRAARNPINWHFVDLVLVWHVETEMLSIVRPSVYLVAVIISFSKLV